MKEPVKNIDLEKKIFAASPENFKDLALEVFQFQYRYNVIYRQFCDSLHIKPGTINSLQRIPFLPISLFKTHIIKTTEFEPEAIFESSGTSNTSNSKHFIKDISLYKKSFTKSFQHFYGGVENKCILGLLPSYLEQQNSSLIMMVDELIKAGGDPLSGFYLYDHDKLHRTVLHNEILKQPTLLIGVTYALLDFAANFPMLLRHTIIIETGGMKSRKEEMTRQQVHRQLQKQFGDIPIHAEYGMTELLSQAWSKGDGIFHCPAWMKILLRDEDDPLQIHTASAAKEKPVTGAINCIDLANIYSCSFIATDDLGRLYDNESFEVLGRLDNSDSRGCSLLVV